MTGFGRQRHVRWTSCGVPARAAFDTTGMVRPAFDPSGRGRDGTLIDETAVWKQIIPAKR